MKKDKLKYIYLSLWSLLIFVMLTFPMKEFETHEQTYYDKGVHFILFGVFSFLLFRVLIQRKDEFFKSAILSLLFGSLYAFSLEFLQNYVPGRTVDELDLLAGVGGAILAMFYAFFIHKSPKPSLLLHVCCIGCGVYVSQLLKKEFKVTLYFYNPNIFPLREYEKRLEEIKKVARRYRLKVILGDYDHDKWREMVRGYEKEPERGARCMLCYRERLENTAKYANKNNFHYFATTLTTSPHKNAKAIMKFGQELGREYELGFLDRDFKKNDGFKKSAALSRELQLYRQDYCGCEFSLAEAEKRRKARESK
ncbi:hypothetical protein C0584_01165 [Candidatus Parcubacteria bacterium]|nr:MAG: hypothetical protein C0584_01165 [Candidatus Parcubacteria bacterium]